MRENKILAIVLTIAMAVIMLSDFNMTKGAAAGETFRVVSPGNNKLIGAGHFDITWTEAISSSVKDYKLYIDGELVTTTTNTSYEYYTTNVKMYSVYVTAQYNDGTSQSTEAITFGVTKKGLCANEEMAQYLEPVEMNIGWYYNWASHPHSYDAYNTMEYVPMIWGTGNEGDISYVASTGYKHLLAYNEPDMGGDVGGSRIDVNTAISHWGNFLGNNYYLGTPAPGLSPSWDNGTWFRTFMDGINHDTVDFIPLHCYYWQYTGKEAAENFLTNVVDKTYEMYHKPIWITEFAVYGWGYNDTNSESVKEFMKATIDGLNARSYVERYAWFSFDTTDTTNGVGSLYNYATGDLTDMGRTYVEYGNPEGYSPLPLDGQNYTMFSRTRSTLLDNSVSINGKTYEDYINSSGVSATATSINSDSTTADKAIDGDITTRWESQYQDPQTITIDLGQIRDVKQLNIIWETASARTYNIQVSTDGQNYSTIAQENDGLSYNYKNDTVVLNEMVKARYIKITATGRSTEYGYSIWDMAIYGKSGEEETTTELPTVEETTVFPEEETTSGSNIVTSDKVKVLGYQMNTTVGGNRVIASVEPEINNKQVSKWGLVYAITSLKENNFSVTDNDILVDSNSIYVHAYESSKEVGTSSVAFGTSDTATYYIRTMLFSAFNENEFTAWYKVRPYAQLEDGSYVYGNICSYSVYNISNYLYQNRMMNNFSSHQYLYNTILKTVNPDYSEVDYDWSNVVVK